MGQVIDLKAFQVEVAQIAGRLDALQERAQETTESPEQLLKLAVVELQTTVEELRVSQEEMSAQSEALADSRQDLEEEHARYRSLFQAAPSAYLVTDLRGVVREANQTAVDLLHVDLRFLIGKPLASFVVPSQRQELRRRMGEVAGTGRTQQAQWDVQPRRHPPIPGLFDVALLRQNGLAESLLWLVRDLSTQRSLEQRTDQLTERLTHAASDAPAAPSEATVQLAIADVTGQLLDQQSLDEMLRRVAAHGLAIIPGASGVSLSVYEQGRPRIGGCSAPWVAGLDDAQDNLQEGPCLSAVATGEWHVSGDLDEDRRWPRWGAQAAEQGVLSVLSVPMLVRTARLGVLNVYSSARDAFSGEALRIAQQFAVAATVPTANAQILAASRRLSAELDQALVSRSTVDMAKGILMARLGVDADTAFEALRDLSQRRHLKLRDLAAELIRSPRG